jgi:cyclic 2,3-diphosphoglycerate synthetase
VNASGVDPHGVDPREPAIALIDGEHYPPVVVDTLRELSARYRFVAALFLGGGEKLRERQADGLDELYGLPVTQVPAAAAGAPGAGRGGGASAGASGAGVGAAALRGALAEVLAGSGARVVVDVSDEPVLGYEERFQLISVALSWGARYVGADFQFSPQPLARLSSKPSLAIIGTGKRVGKTAVSGLFGRRLGARYGLEQVVIVAMGRGGPAAPQVVYGGDKLGAQGLLAVSRQGLHAASDYLEDAVLTGVTTIGCRRCGGGMAGASMSDTVGAALGVVHDMDAAIVVFEGSGSAIPPVQAQAVVCVASAMQPPEYITGYLGTYRMLISDALFLTMCEPPFCDAARVAALRDAVSAINPDIDVVPTVFRPRPVDSVAGRRVAYFSTAAPESADLLARHLEEVYGAHVTLVSTDLARRPALQRAIAAAADKADVFLTEIKAAAVDVVAEAAAAQRKELVFCDNEPVALDGRDLLATIDGLTDTALARYAAGRYGPHDSAAAPRSAAPHGAAPRSAAPRSPDPAEGGQS